MNANGSAPLVGAGRPRPVEPRVGVVHTVGGKRLEDATPCAATETPSLRVARGRTGERLFIVLNLSGPASPRLYRELCEQIAQTYWATTGSITAALRKAAAAANRHLFNVNLRTAPSERCEGGLICAVLHGEDMFVLQAGSGQACLLHGDHMERLTRGEEPAPLGLGPLADVRLHHTFVAPGDTMLLTSLALVREAGDAGLTRVLLRAEMEAVIEGLEQIGAGVDFAAQVIRWVSPQEAPAVPEVRRPATRPARPVGARAPRPATRPARPARARSPRPSLRPLGEHVKRGINAVARGIGTAGAGLARGATALFRRMLPGRERKARRRTRPAPPVPEENRTMMILVAIGIPVLLAIVVALTYPSLGIDARVRGLVSQAQGEIALAEAAGGISEEARPHWEAALAHARAALALRPGDAAAAGIEAQAQVALDRLDNVTRLHPVRLWDFGPGSAPRQLAVHGQTIFVLDPAGGWVARLTLNPTADGVVEQPDAPMLVQTGQQVSEGKVGDLVDLVWVGSGAERQTSGLVILEEGGALVSHDPAWTDVGAESPRLSRSFLGTAPGAPQSVGTYGGRLYVLDREANQVWRYEPRGDTYPEQPDRYFATPPPKSLGDALDMAIDGYIYILYEDGQILQFLQGEHQPAFEVHGLKDDEWQAVALAVDPGGGSDAIYVADQGNKRVIVLGPDGGFQTQFRADEAFDALEALAVDEAAGRLYAVSGGQLTVASLP